MIIDFQKIKTNDLPFLHAIAMGRVPYMQRILKFGNNEAVGTGAFEDIWDSGGTEVLLSSAETMTIVSDSTEDGPAGTGTREMIMFGFNNDYDPIQEVITLNGTTPIVTQQEFLRVYRAYATDTGSNGSNVGNITFTATVAGTAHASIEVGESQTQKTQFTIPRGFYGLLLYIHLSALKNDQYKAELRVKEFGQAERTLMVNQSFESIPTLRFDVPYLIPPRADMKIRAINTASGQADISAFYELVLVKESEVNTTGIIV